MKKLILPLFLLTSFVSFGQLWTEDFAAEANGAITGTAGGTIGGTWNVTTLPSGGAASFSRQNPLTFELFRANQTGNEGVWNSGSIDISGTGMATISLDLTTAGTNSTDYVRAYYKVDGGPEILFAELLGQAVSLTSPGSAIISGSSVEIVIRSMENTPGLLFFFFGPPNAIGFDNLSVAEVSTVFSRKSSTWTDVTAGDGTWSILALGGVSCDCTPTVGQVAIIGNSNTVTLPSSQSVGGVNVKNTGVFQYNTNGTTLTVLLGLFRVESGGTVNSSGGGITGEQIQFDADVGGANFQIDVGGSAAIEIFSLGTNASNLHYLTGGGTLSIADDILIGADDATLTNDMTTAIAVTDRIEFSAGTTNASFVNNGTLSAASLIVNGDDGNSFTNASGATTNIGTIDLNNGNFTINNSGTLNQSGNFSNIDTGSNGNFNNLATGVWNWTLTPNTTFDTSMGTVLDASASGNTFTYSGAGAQRIIPAQYSNLTLSVSGAKDSNAGSISVNGNWTVSGTASFTETGSTVTLNGAVAQSLTSTGLETFDNLTINNSFATSPQITLNNAVTVSTVLTMTDGNVNLNGNTFTLTSTANGALDHTSGWMYGGSINRAFRDGTVTLGTDRGLLPIGTSANFRPFFFGKSNPGGDDSGTLTISHSDPGTTTTGLTIGDLGPVVTIIRRNNSAWTSTLTGGGSSVFGIQYGGTGMGTVTSLLHLRSMLFAAVIRTHVASSGSFTDPRVERSGLLEAGANNEMTNVFYMGSTNNASPLPIELLYFNAKLNNDIVDLSWSTASEKDNDFFTIERAINIEEFETIGDPIDGKGTTNEKSNYTTQDETPVYGRSYYRLKQTDFDGKFTYSDLQVINYEGPRFSSLQVYPNPSHGNALTIVVTGLKEQPTVPVQIYNVQGQKVFDRVLDVNTPGTLRYDAEFGSPLRQGLYIIKAGQTLQLTQKLIVD